MDALASHIWQSTVFGGAAFVLAFMLRRNGASVRYWIWLAAAMKFVVPFAALTAVINQMPWPHAPDRAGDVLNAATVVFRSASLPSLSQATSNAIVAVWIAGASLVLGRWIWVSARLAAHVRVSPLIGDGVVFDALRRIEGEEAISTPTTIVSSCLLMEPGVFGIRKPVLIWPQHLMSRLDDAHIEAVVAHEVCHIARRDNLLSLPQMAVSAIFWFHPMVWWIGNRLVDERERACDERVLARGGRASTYAESILKTCQLCITSPLVNVAGVTGGQLKTRIVRIMTNAPAASLGWRKKCALVLAALLTVLVPSIGGGSRPAAAAEAQDQDREVHRPGGRVTLPKLLRDVKPQYSARAIQEKVEGEVLMECVVKADGTVGDKKIVKSLHPDLDQAALDAAAQWLFEPGKRDDKPANVLVTITMAFTLK